MSETRRAAGYREIEHTADKAVEVWAPSLPELFEQAARAMFSLMTDVDDIVPVSRHELTLEMPDAEVALVDWLSELLYWRETQGELYGEFHVSLRDGALHGTFAGAPGVPRSPVIKAATYHDLRVARRDDGLWQARIVFDT